MNTEPILTVAEAVMERLCNRSCQVLLSPDLYALNIQRIPLCEPGSPRKFVYCLPISKDAIILFLCKIIVFSWNC